MEDLYLFEDGEDVLLILHVPESPGSFLSSCGKTFDEEDFYLPDPDQSIVDFCHTCAEAWIEINTTNKNNWRIV